jgi:hypothetical protein
VQPSYAEETAPQRIPGHDDDLADTVTGEDGVPDVASHRHYEGPPERNRDAT